MSKINISFNGIDYSIDDALMAPATTELQGHLASVMNGSGATINLGGTAYNIDSAKLQAATNDFITHLGTIAGNGHKVMVNGVEYGIDSTKLTGAISDIEAVLAGTGEERLEGDGAEYYTLAPTALSFRSTAPLNELQEVQINGVTVDPANYTLEEGSTIVTFPIEYLKTLDVGNYEVAVASDSKTVKGDFTVAAPELNEHGFYYNQPYVGYVEYFSTKASAFIRENGTVDVILKGNTEHTVETCPYVINENSLTVTTTGMGELNFTISSDGTAIYNMELATTFALGDETFVADKDYLYVYREDLGGYEVVAIDKTKSYYSPINTNINGIATVKLVDNMFYDTNSIWGIGSNMIEAPKIPNTVIKIGQQAFCENNNLKVVNIPSSVEYIYQNAFYSCNAITDVIFGENSNLVSIEERAFANCINLVNISIPNNVMNIGTGAFDGCKAIENITIPDSVETICSHVFARCSGLTSVTIGNGVDTISPWAFTGCTKLSDIRYVGTISEWNEIVFFNDAASNWNSGVPATYVQCSDGQVAL